MKKKKILVLSNIILFIAIAFFLFIKIYKEKVFFQCEYGKHPTELLKVVSENFPGIEKKRLEAICVFNNLPGITVIENIKKLYNLYKDSVSFGVIFTDKFRSIYDFSFPYKILPGYKFSCNDNKDTEFEKNYFLFLIDGKIFHKDINLNFFDINFTLLKRLNPGLNYMDAQISTVKLKSRIIERMNGNDLELLNITTDALEKFDSFSEFSKIYFFHANCSSCVLKSLIKDMLVKRIFDEEKILVIFSIFANRFELQSLLDENHVNLPVYIDNKDEFLLSSKITNEKKNPVIITGEELRSIR